MDVSSDSTSVTTLSSRRPRLTIVEQHVAFADALEGSLWGSFRVRQVVVSSTSTASGVVAATRATRPDLTLVTTRLGPFIEGEAVIDGLARTGVAVVALCPSSADADPVRWGRCLRAGAIGVLSHTCALATLHEALDRALAGEPVLGRSETDRVLSAARRADADPWSARARLDSLTPREREVVTHLMGGLCTAEIARRSVVSEATVRTQIKSVLSKLGVRSQLAAVAVAHRAGWSAPADHWISVAS
ncbi:response regulator transcription factor [Nocardioides sp. YIM 152315]|uniref:response regulator transcription factor n=1 Tax=Nocardioides sp. YIM 152315 TaxID=3031760 RepID=UPI0023DCCA3F|nr:response regulator transcription factor [Nocardioides sp. YIM 152315]MDF1606290.1 response regulator transcription factor [Nocardioides sp. YIM 152315]